MIPAPSIVLLEINIGEPVEILINETFAIDYGYMDLEFVCIFYAFKCRNNSDVNSYLMYE